MRDGLPRPVTQIRVGKRRIDMGWPEWNVGVEYDGEQHWTNPDDYAEDIERLEFLATQGFFSCRCLCLLVKGHTVRAEWPL